MPYTPKIILATGTDQGFAYEPYLVTVNKYSQVENYLICVDFWPHPSTLAHFPNINFRLIRRDQIDTDVPVNCVQNGDFLKVLDLHPADIVIFTDGDIRMQRPLGGTELAWLMSFKAGDFSAQYNAGTHDTLWWDTSLIGIRDKGYVYDRLLEGGKYANNTCYNVGVVVMTYSTYQALHDIYVRDWNLVKDAFTHQAKQQWLMSLIVARDGFNGIEMPYTFHMHGCFDLPAGSRLNSENQLTYQDEVVLFRHNYRGAGW